MKKIKAFTLIETLIYVGIFSIVALSLTGILWNTLRVNSNQQAANEVDENLRYIMGVLSEKVRSSTVVDAATSSTLVLKNSSYEDITFSVVDGVLYLQEGSAALVAVSSNKVLVDSLTFTKIEMAGAKDGVRVDITLSYNSDKAELAFSKNMISSINRVAAITFDSDLLPDTNNLYSIGADNPRWKNGYFSGDLYVTGNETLTGNLAIDTNVFFVDSANNKVGIGTITPAEVLQVSGNIKFGDKIYNSYGWSLTSSNLVPDPYFNDMSIWTGESGNSLESVLLPTGEYVQSLKITTTGSVQVISGFIPVNSEKTYRASLWIKTSDATVGTRYFGFNCYNSAKTQIPCYKSDGTTSTNVYFWSGDLAVNTFYKKTGYLFGYNTANSWTDPSDTASTNYRLASDVGYVKIRFLNYYNSETEVTNWFALPTLEEVQSTNREWAIKDNGDVVSLSGGRVTNVSTPTASSDVATKGYVDAAGTTYTQYVQYFATSGVVTWTNPNGAASTTISVIVVGGGGGGGGGCNSASTASTGSTGGTSSFGALASATGGTGGSGGGNGIGSQPGGTGYNAGGPGGDGDNTTYGNVGAVGGIGFQGCGSGGAGAGAWRGTGAGGGSGNVKTYYGVVTGASYTVTIGAGGAGGASTLSTTPGAAGAPGCVIVYWWDN